MVLAIDQIVSQAAKWSYVFGGQVSAVTFRGIINVMEQGAQHSQALHSWYAHVPGLRVVMPATVSDARDLLISSVLSPDRIMFIDDRWLYDREEDLKEIEEIDLAAQGPIKRLNGTDITLVGAGYLVIFARERPIKNKSISAEVVDLRVINPIDPSVIVESVKKTGNLLVVDGGWTNCGLAGEIIALVCERLSLGSLKSSPQRITLPDCPAPTSKTLEAAYYPDCSAVVDGSIAQLGR